MISASNRVDELKKQCMALKKKMKTSGSKQLAGEQESPSKFKLLEFIDRLQSQFTGSFLENSISDKQTFTTATVVRGIQESPHHGIIPSSFCSQVVSNSLVNVKCTKVSPQPSMDTMTTLM